MWRENRRNGCSSVSGAKARSEAGKKFGGEVGVNAGVAPVEVLDGLHRMILQPVANRQCEREVEATLRRHLGRATECASIFYARDVNFRG